jgi:hypothetical protein
MVRWFQLPSRQPAKRANRQLCAFIFAPPPLRSLAIIFPCLGSLFSIGALSLGEAKVSDVRAARLQLPTSTAIIVEPFGWSAAIPGECWQNARKTSQSFGGTLAYGWVLAGVGPTIASKRQFTPVYHRWINHVLWRDANGRLWEVTPHWDTEHSDQGVWLPSHFILEKPANVEVDDSWQPKPAIYVSARPEGDVAADCLNQAVRAARDQQEPWLERALRSLPPAEFTPREWRVERVGDHIRDAWLIAE